MHEHPVLKTSPKSRAPFVALVGIALVAALAGLVAWRVSLQPRTPERVTLTADVDAGVTEPSVDPAQGDVFIGDLVPQNWLEGGDAIRRAAAAVEAVAVGESPRVLVPFLDPGGTFTVDERKGKFFVSAKNDARYDAVTKVVTSIDAAAVGRLYGKVRPYLEAAHREIAPPGKSFDAAFTQAVDRLAAVPISDGPREVVPLEQGVGYAWADPKLEALKPAEKHLLRMGPGNARAVVKQLEAFRAAMNASTAASL